MKYNKEIHAFGSLENDGGGVFYSAAFHFFVNQKRYQTDAKTYFISQHRDD